MLHSAKWTLFVGIATCVMGCEDSHDHAHDSPQDEACEHLTDGPASSQAASDSDNDSVPDISTSHTRFDLALPGEGDKKGGYAKFISPKAGD